MLLEECLRTLPDCSEAGSFIIYQIRTDIVCDDIINSHAVLIHFDSYKRCVMKQPENNQN